MKGVRKEKRRKGPTDKNPLRLSRQGECSLPRSHAALKVIGLFCFGKYWDAVRRACLEPDFEAFPNRDLTEVGERVGFSSEDLYSFIYE